MKLLASGMLFASVLAFVACSSSGQIAPARDAGVEASPPDDSNEIPCDAREVLQTVCQQCHSNPPVRGAPFPLVTRSNVLAARPGGVARDLMIAQLQAHRMPLAPVTIEDAQRETLLAWLQGGAAAVPAQSCTGVDAGADADAGDDGDAADAEPSNDGSADSDASDASAD
jgi:uncharacterized membrane protein